MQDLFIPLLAGHLIGDFLLQTRAMAEAKKGLQDARNQAANGEDQ